MTAVEPLLTEPQVAKILSISPRKLMTLRRAGEINHISSGKSIRYDIRDICDWIDQHRRSGDPSRN
jgi:alpha-galactosidase/6-phospho-beta-glucosidase family protein